MKTGRAGTMTSATAPPRRCGDRLAESRPFTSGSTLISADVDLGLIRQERMRVSIFGDCGQRVRADRKSHCAWRDIDQEIWPKDIPEAQGNTYTLAKIRHWKALFLTRFFANQFERSALPNSLKISSGGSLSPRGDWRAPSDAHADVWLADLARSHYPRTERLGVPR